MNDNWATKLFLLHFDNSSSALSKYAVYQCHQENNCVTHKIQMLCLANYYFT